MKITQYVRQEKVIASADSGRKSIDTSWYVEQERRIQECVAEARWLRYEHRQCFDPGHLYVIEFDSGVVKVGKTYNAESRLAAHAKTGPIRSSWVSARHLHCSKTERRLIGFCDVHGQLYSGREYFRELDVRATCAFAHLVVRDAQRRAYLESLIEAADDDLSVTWHDAHSRLAEGMSEPTPDEKLQAARTGVA